MPIETHTTRVQELGAELHWQFEQLLEELGRQYPDLKIDWFKAAWDESKHPRGGDSRNRGRFSSGGGTGRLRNHQREAFLHLAHSLGGVEDNPYRQGLRDALHRIPPAATRRILDHVTKTAFYPTIESLDEVLGDPGQGMIGFRGAYEPWSGRLYLDTKNWTGKKKREIYAHELSHAIDGFHYELSGTKEWKDAWAKEIKGAQLLEHSQYGPEEGFADFGAALYTGDSPDELQRKFPVCYKFWQERGLI